MKLFVPFFLMMFILVGCISNENKYYMPYSGGFVPLITIDSSQPKVLDWDNAEEVKFEDIIEDIRYIPLRDEEGIMGEQINQLLYCNGIFYLLDFQQDEVFLYNEEGRCVKKISDRGQGPKEYIAIGNIDINPETSELYVQDRILSSVLVYDLNGNFKYKFKLPVQNSVVYSIGDSTRLVQMQAFQNKGSEEMEGYSYLVMKGDSAYRKGFKYLPSQIGFCGADGVNDSYDNQSLYYQPLFSDSIYHVLSDSVCSLAYYFKDKESVWKKHWESDKFVNMINAQGTAIMDIYDLREQLLAYVNEGIGKRLKVMIYDKRNGKTYDMSYNRAKDVDKIHDMWGLNLSGTYKGEYVACLLSSSYIEENMRARVEAGELEITNPKLKDIVMEIDSDCNPVLVLVKFKLPSQ